MRFVSRDRCVRSLGADARFLHDVAIPEAADTVQRVRSAVPQSVHANYFTKSTACRRVAELKSAANYTSRPLTETDDIGLPS